MKSILLAALLALCGCATVNPYAYSGVMTPAECRADCAGYGYPMLRVQNGGCECDTSKCFSSVGCEQLPPSPTPPPAKQL